MIRGPLAVVLALLVAAIPVAQPRADDPTGVAECGPTTPAPKTSARLRWRSPDGGEGALGTWVSDPSMQHAAVRFKTCTDGWTKCQVDLSVERGKRVTIGWKAWAIGIGVALSIGFVAGSAVVK